MRILLTANASYAPPRGGATRANLVWLDDLAAQGHTCEIVASALPDDPSAARQAADEQLDWKTTSESSGVRKLRRAAIDLYAVAARSQLPAVLRERIRALQPDWVLVSSEDLGHVLLREAHHSAPRRVVYLAHTPQFFPFGPASWNPDARAASLVARAAGVVAIGSHTAGYIRRHIGRDAAVIHPPIYGDGPFADLASFDSGSVATVNPCALKGVSIFLGLADRFPHTPFATLPGWGTTAADRAQLTARPNITLLPNYRDIAQFLAGTRVLLMPSLWYEGFGLAAMEAMLHGIPVIASDSGGLVEAKLGTPFVIPVHPIERFEPVFDEHALPQPVIDPSDLGPWQDALRALLSDRSLYHQVSADSRHAALAFVRGLRASQLGQYLEKLAPGEDPGEPAGSLSPARRDLLLRMMRTRPGTAPEPR
jgi:glycosyltransferase involved in cell wall biosynthesis